LQSISEHIQQVLSDYFNSSLSDEIKNLINASGKGKTQNIEVIGDPPLSVAIENYSEVVSTLIKFAVEKLEASRLLEFLFHIGEYSISLGELQTATEVYKRIYSLTGEKEELQSVKAYSYLALGDIYSRQAEWRKSSHYLNQANKLFKVQKDFHGSARCENILGTIYGDKGNIKKAKKHFEKSLSYLDQKQDEYLIGMIEINLGIINNIQGNYDQAFTYHQRAIFKFEQMQDVRRLAEVRNNLGMLYTQKGEFNSALNVYDQSIAVSIQTGYLPTLVVSYLSKSFIYAKLNDLVLANAFLDKAMEGAIKLNDRLSIADIYKIKGIVEKNQKNYIAAENYFNTSISINVELENILNQAESAFELALLYLEMSRQNDAVRQFEYSLGNYKKLDSTIMCEKLEKMIQKIKAETSET
jgi:tetratricopeptide (TPR) repeat protein